MPVNITSGFFGLQKQYVDLDTDEALGSKHAIQVSVHPNSVSGTITAYANVTDGVYASRFENVAFPSHSILRPLC